MDFGLSFNDLEVILNIENGLGLLINALLIITLVCVRKLRETQANVYLCNLFASYFVRSFASFLLYAFQDDVMIFAIALELIQAFFVWSSLSLVLVTLDRFLAIRMPFRYQFQTAVTAVRRVLLFVWLPTIVYIAVTLAVKPSADVVDIQVVSTALVALFSLIISNVYIFTVVRQHIRNTAISISPAVTSTTTTVTTTMTPTPTPTATTNSNQKSRLKSITRQIKAAYGCFAFVAIFVAAWSSQCVVLILSMSGNITLMEKLQYMAWTIPLVTMDSFMGPIAYVVFSSEIKSALKAFFLRCQ